MAADSRTVRGLVLGGCALAVLGACSTGSPGPAKTVTVVASQPPAQSTAGTPSASASTSSQPPPLTKLPGTCDSLLPLGSVETAIGHQLAGRTSFVVGLPEKNIGRIGYLNCQYGLATGAKSTPRVEIGISLYRTAAAAEQRLQATITDYLDHGASQAPATVDGQRAAILTGASERGYQIPLLVASSGQRTVAVNVSAALTSAVGAPKLLAQIGTLALQRTDP